MIPMPLMQGRGNSTITVLRKGGRDAFGDPIGDEFAESHQIHNVLIEWQQTNSDFDRREEAHLSGIMYMPLGSDVCATDQVEFPELDGAQPLRVAVDGKPYSYDFALIRGKAVRFRVVTSGR